MLGGVGSLGASLLSWVPAGTFLPPLCLQSGGHKLKQHMFLHMEFANNKQNEFEMVFAAFQKFSCPVMW